MPRSGRAILFGVLCLAYLAAVALVGCQGSRIIGSAWFLVAVTLLFASMIGLWLLKPGIRSVMWILTLGVVGRLAFLAYPASDDVARYIWEGEIQLAGHNPFTTSPNSPELADHRNLNWQGINHRLTPTIYWPFSQVLFALDAAIAPVPITNKVTAMLFDLATLAVLVLLVRRLKTEARHLLFYGLNPLVLVYAAGEGHVEPAMVFWVVLALYFHVSGRSRLSFASLGMGIVTKTVPFLLVPFLLTRRNVRHLWAILPPFLFFLPYLGGQDAFVGIPMFFVKWFHYNGLAQMLLATCLSTDVAARLAMCLALLLFGTFFLFTPSPLKACRNAVAVFLLFAPTMHPWYLILMTPFLVLKPSWSWLLLHLTCLPLIFMWNKQATCWLWHERELLFWVEYVPFVAVALWLWLRNLRASVGDPPTGGLLSVVIPTLNERDNIAECVKSVRQQAARVEIVVADGGSTDGTRELVASLDNVTLVDAPPGRGIQIRAGARSSTGSVVLILHADSRLLPSALSQLATRLRERPDVVGGSFGACYEHPSLRFRLTELINSARAFVLGISFGDQGQFFRRSALVDDLPPYRLMEDIEISYRLKERGEVTFIPSGLLSSLRAWKQRGYLGNLTKVVCLFSLYVVRRRLGMLSGDCRDFQRWYYGR
jgi:hypothetical protein